MLDDFKERFQELYLGDGKIRIGGFDSEIIRLENHNLFKLSFTAVTSNISVMMEESFAVRKWISEFSKASDAIISYLDLEDNGNRILYYKGKEINVTITEGFEEESYNEVSNFVKDYFGLNYDMLFK